MRIAFLIIGNSDRGPLDGETIRYLGVPSSGTDSSAILVAEYLAKQGHEVVVAVENCTINKVYRLVKYTNINFDSIENKDFDVLVTCLWYSSYDKLPIKVNKALIYWFHLAWMYSIKEIQDYLEKNNISFGAVHVSEWEKSFNEKTIKSIFKNVNTKVIPNAIACDVAKEVLDKRITKKNKKTVFHGQWSRGGSTALKAFQDLGWDEKNFVSFDYIKNSSQRVDKKTLFEELASSEYFIFPSFTNGKLIYKDTFSCSVAEALAMGVIVLTYPLGALPEYYNDYCVWLDFPDGANLDKLAKEAVSEDPNFGKTDKIVLKIKEIESNCELKNKLLYSGTNYILENFSIEKIGPMWDEYLKNYE